jgi:zinc transporter ZupT
VISISFPALLLFAVFALAATFAGVALSGIPELSRRVLPFSGVMLLLISIGWILPELAGDLGWFTGLSFMMVGFVILWLIDKHVYPVCPSCSHTHDHDSCSTRLHGFAAPLVAATAIHSTFDGWALAAAHAAGSEGIWAGIIIHKIPECLVFGIILRAAMKSRRNAMIAASLAQAATFLGAALEIQLAPHIGAHFILVLLAIAGGTFLYLGFHAVHGEWKRRTAATLHSH